MFYLTLDFFRAFEDTTPWRSLMGRVKGNFDYNNKKNINFNSCHNFHSQTRYRLIADQKTPNSLT